MVVVGWKEIYQTSKKKKKNHEGGKRKKGRVEGWVLVEGYRRGEPRATSMEQAVHSLLGES